MSKLGAPKYSALHRIPHITRGLGKTAKLFSLYSELLRQLPARTGQHYHHGSQPREQ